MHRRHGLSLEHLHLHLHLHLYLHPQPQAVAVGHGDPERPAFCMLEVAGLVEVLLAQRLVHRVHEQLLGVVRVREGLRVGLPAARVVETGAVVRPHQRLLANSIALGHGADRGDHVLSHLFVVFLGVLGGGPHLYSRR